VEPDVYIHSAIFIWLACLFRDLLAMTDEFYHELYDSEDSMSFTWSLT
jgi:hypothetical protein